ncbi:hypothetical protein ACF1GY_37270 [Streptomyces sp. NPDC014684]|uniref:hypothetical protein n=1 Tax=Streptomyces sp. NPDC014684 TaxID=3364880 RepID=UPI0037027F65
MGEKAVSQLTAGPFGPAPSARLRIMAHRPYPNRERARRQVDRHNGDVSSWAVARARANASVALRVVDGFRADEYRLSTADLQLDAGSWLRSRES